MRPLKNFKGKAIIISAPSGAGKTTLVKRLLETNFQLNFLFQRAAENQEKMK